jgi:hypothetical protein
VVSVTARPRFTSGKGPHLPTVQEAGWASRAGLDTEARGKNSFASVDDRIPAVQYVFRHYTELHQLLKTLSIKQNLKLGDSEFKSCSLNNKSTGFNTNVFDLTKEVPI